MRILRFIVNEQIIEKDPNCNFEGLVPGSSSRIKAVFSFSPDWNSSVKVASFRSMLGKEYPPQPLKDGYSCIIPPEALARRAFKVQIIGSIKGVGMVSTNKITVEQNGGK